MNRRLVFAVTFLVGLALTAVGVAGFFRDGGATLPSILPSAQPSPRVEIQPETPTPPPASSPTPEPSRAPIASLIIEKLGVNAPRDDSPTMDVPDAASDVAVYPSITGGHPGHPGNSAFSGHVNLCNPRCVQGVFLRLQNLKDGDIVRVRLEDDTEYAYRVTRNWLVSADNAPMDQIIGPPAEGEGPEVITLITCGGTLVAGPGGARLYAERVIVRAVRTYG